MKFKEVEDGLCGAFKVLCLMNEIPGDFLLWKSASSQEHQAGRGIFRENIHLLTNSSTNLQLVPRPVNLFIYMSVRQGTVIRQGKPLQLTHSVSAEGLSALNLSGWACGHFCKDPWGQNLLLYLNSFLFTFKTGVLGHANDCRETKQYILLNSPLNN